MAYNILEQGFRILLDNGLVAILVFALIFVVVYGILMNVKLFGDANENGKKYNAVIALALGALSILPHYLMRGSKYDVVKIVSEALPQTMLVLVVLLGVLILLGMFGWNVSEFSENNWLKPVVAIVLLGIVIWIFASAAGNRMPYWLSYDVMAVIVALAVFGGIIYFVIGGKED